MVVMEGWVKMATKAAHSVTGAVHGPHKPPKSFTKWIVVVILSTFLFLLSLQARFTASTNGISLCTRSQYFLHSTLLDIEYAKAPPVKPAKPKPANTSANLIHLAIIVLLAGDVEINPGPETELPLLRLQVRLQLAWDSQLPWTISTYTGLLPPPAP